MMNVVCVMFSGLTFCAFAFLGSTSDSAFASSGVRDAATTGQAPSRTYSVPCADQLNADGYCIGLVRDVLYDVTPEGQCLTTVAIETLRSSPHIAEVDTLLGEGGACDGSLSIVFFDPGGSRTFSFAVGELAIFAVCTDQEQPWILDKGTLWASQYERTAAGVRAFHNDVRNRCIALEDLEVHRGFSPEVLRAPDPAFVYHGARAQQERDAWFLHEVGRTPSFLRVSHFIAAIETGIER